MKTALLVLENPVVRLQMLHLLGRHGWWVDAANRVEWALALLDQEPADVVLIDWQVGAGSGLAVLHAIKTNARWRCVPVVLAHPGLSPGERDRVFALGVNDFLSEPFTAEAALRRLDRWVLDHFSPLRQNR